MIHFINWLVFSQALLFLLHPEGFKGFSLNDNFLLPFLIAIIKITDEGKIYK